MAIFLNHETANILFLDFVFHGASLDKNTNFLWFRGRFSGRGSADGGRVILGTGRSRAGGSWVVAGCCAGKSDHRKDPFW